MDYMVSCFVDTHYYLLNSNNKIQKNVVAMDFHDTNANNFPGRFASSRVVASWEYGRFGIHPIPNNASFSV